MINPHINHDININGTLNMLRAASEAKVKRFVFASSAATYGDDPVIPKVEDMQRHYPSPYALSKGVDEDYAQLWSYVKDNESLGGGMTCIGLRYFNVFGPRQDPTSPYSGVISKFTSLITNGQGVTVFGDGKQTRDFVFVKDVVQANLLAGIKTIPNGLTYRVYNVGTGLQTNLIQLVAAIDDVLERPADNRTTITQGQSRAGNIRDSLSNIDRIHTELGYKPEYPLREGLAILLKYLKDNPDSANPTQAAMNLSKGNVSDFQRISTNLFE
jgi:UDP-glucose 4-epimerase